MKLDQENSTRTCSKSPKTCFIYTKRAFDVKNIAFVNFMLVSGNIERVLCDFVLVVWYVCARFRRMRACLWIIRWITWGCTLPACLHALLPARPPTRPPVCAPTRPDVRPACPSVRPPTHQPTHQPTEQPPTHRPSDHRPTYPHNLP